VVQTENTKYIKFGDCVIMKTTYENELRNLQNWINNVNNGLATGAPIGINLTSADNTCYLINVVANEIEEEYPIPELFMSM